MSDTQLPRSAGTGRTGAEAAVALAEIQRRQGRVVRTVLVPVWYWWAVAAGVVVIGVARDSGDPVVQAIAIPLAVLVTAGLTGAMIPALRRRVQLHNAMRPGARGAAAIVALIVLVDAVILGATAGLAAAGVSHPATVGTVAGAAVIVIAGPLVNRYLGTLMLSQLGQHVNDGPPIGDNTP